MTKGPAHRAYGGTADLQVMQEAVQRVWTPQSYWHIGDLAWGRKPRPSQHLGPTALWEIDGQVVAWGCVELPGDLGVFVNPDHPGLADQVLAWFDGVTTGADRSVTVMATDDHLIHALQRAGYQPAQGAPFFDHCLLELTGALPVPELPAGYRIRAVRADEARARAAVHRAAWRPRRIGKLLVPPVDLSGESTLTAASYQAVMDTWPYQPQLDQVVQAPDGTLVAFALGWLDKDNRVGELEPVGTARRTPGKAWARPSVSPAYTPCGNSAPPKPWSTPAGTAPTQCPGTSTDSSVSALSPGPSPTFTR